MSTLAPKSAKEHIHEMLEHGVGGKPLSARDRTSALTALARLEVSEGLDPEAPMICPHCHAEINSEHLPWGVTMLLPVPPELNEETP